MTTTPGFLRSLYKTSAYTPAATDQNALGTVGLLSHYPSPEDLAAFMTKYRSDGAGATVVEVEDGGYNPSNPDPEANLDVQYAEAMTYPTSLIFFSTGREPPVTGDWFISWLRYIFRQQHVRAARLAWPASASSGSPVATTVSARGTPDGPSSSSTSSPQAQAVSVAFYLV